MWRSRGPCARGRAALALAVAVFWGAGAHADSVKLANGDTLTGEIVEFAVDHLVIDHPQLGRIRLALDELEIDTGEPPTRGLFNTRFLRGWTRQIEFGASGEQGNSDSLTLTTGLNFRYADEFKRWRIQGRQFFDVSDGSVDDNNLRVDVRRDWLVPTSRWFWYAASRYQFDQETDWKHRTVLSAGPGYKVVQHPSHTLDFLLGPSFSREYEGENDNKGEILFGQDYLWTISERASFEVSNQFLLNVQPDFGNIRNFTSADLRIRFFDAPALNLVFGLQNEFDSDPPGDDEVYDLKYSSRISLDF